VVDAAMTGTRKPARAGAGTVIDVALLYRMLDVDEDDSHYRLVWESRRRSFTLPHLVLSALDAEGYPLGAGARDELRRASDRNAAYSSLARTICEGTQARVVKGPSIGIRYPRGLQRPVGDLDLIVPGECQLWAAVRTVVDAQPSCGMDISVSGAGPGHCVVSLSWPGADPALDPWHGVDVCTAAFCGNGGSVGIRPLLPADQLTADVLSLAEERFQRPFWIKDFLDVFVLARAQDCDPVAVAGAADRYQLAPELAELAELAGRYGSTGVFGEIARLAGQAAVRERTRRDAITSSGPSASDVPLRHGYLLRRTEWREHFAPAVRHVWEEGTILRTPLGDYLLVDSGTVTTGEHENAMRELRRVMRCGGEEGGE
jgi:hypothetical protein